MSEPSAIATNMEENSHDELDRRMAEAVGACLEASKQIAQWLTKKGLRELDVFEQLSIHIEILKKYRKGYGPTKFEKTYDKCDALLGQLLNLGDFFNSNVFSGVFLANVLSKDTVSVASVKGALRWGDSLTFVQREELVADRLTLRNFIRRLKKNAISLMRHNKWKDDWEKISKGMNPKKLEEMAVKLEAELTEDDKVDIVADVDAVLGQE